MTIAEVRPRLKHQPLVIVDLHPEQPTLEPKRAALQFLGTIPCREARLDHVQDSRLTKKVAELQRRGVRALCCDRCGMNSGLSRYFEGCNSMNDAGETCDGTTWVEVMGK